MTDQPPGRRSPADEQRTTALPRPAAHGSDPRAHDPRTGQDPRARPESQQGDDPQWQRGPQRPGTGPDRRPPASPPPPPEYETTILQRPTGPATPSNLPGAPRPAPPATPAGYPPTGPSPASGARPPAPGHGGSGAAPYPGAPDPRGRRDYPRGRDQQDYQQDYRDPDNRDPDDRDPDDRDPDDRGRPPRRSYRDRGYPSGRPGGYPDDYRRDDRSAYAGDYRSDYPDDAEAYRDEPFDREPRHRSARTDRPDTGGRSALPPYTEPPYAEPGYTEPGYRNRGHADAGHRDHGDRHPADPDGTLPRRGLTRSPRKITVTRVAALRSRQLTHRGLEMFHGAVSKDGADRSGLGHLTYAVMANYAVDAALAVALANTLFFAAAKADSTGKVLLYLLLTVAPFAVIAPFIGPLLDRLQNGRRIALAASSFGRAVLAIVMAVKFDSWVIYPCALGMLVLSKSFGVLKAALTPRVLPDAITLVKTNSRLTVFGLIAGGVSGAIAAGIAGITNSAGALGFTAAVAVVGGWLCLRIPAWVESTEGEVPVELGHSAEHPRDDPAAGRRRHRVLPRAVSAVLFTNSTIRVETGFLALFIAFVIKSRYTSSSVVATPGATALTPTDEEGLMQLVLLGAIGAAAGLGGFVGNALGARLPLRAPGTVALVCLGTVIAAVLAAFLMPGLVTAGVVAFVGSTASSLAKVCLDSTIQQNLPEVSRASAFGRSESVLQLSWVFGGVIGLLIGGVWALGGDTVYMVGFGIIGLVLLAGAAQCLALRTGHSLLPQVSLRALLRRNAKHDTTPVPRPAGPVPGTPPQPSTRPSPPSGQPPATGTRRPVRKAGKPR